MGEQGASHLGAWREKEGDHRGNRNAIMDQADQQNSVQVRCEDLLV